MAAKGWPCHFMDNLHIFVDKCNFILGGHKTGILGEIFSQKENSLFCPWCQNIFYKSGEIRFWFQSSNFGNIQ